MNRFALVLLIFLVGCKNIISKQSDYKESRFKIILDIKVLKNDIFQVFYTTELSEKYSKKNRISKLIKSNSNYQKIIFEIPNNLIPKKIRIDFGEKRKSNIIKVKKITLIKSDKLFIINSDMIPYFFKPNIYIDYDIKEKIFTTKKINGKYDPYLNSASLLNKKLKIYF